MKKIIEMRYIAGRDLNELMEVINAFLDKGWQPHGAIFTMLDAEKNETIFYQVLSIDEKPKSKAKKAVKK